MNINENMNFKELIDLLDKNSGQGNTPIRQALNMLLQQANRIVELSFENNAFRKELFKRGSMDSCSRSAHRHGFVSPAQAGDDAREYIAEILRKAQEQ